MYYAVSDFYNTYKDSMKMLCGKGGLARRVSSVGILDYEFLPEVSGKYKHYNFDKDQLVVSTLMYARDNQTLVGDAVKELINAGVSGLIIKDIFRIRVSDAVLRYAESRNFPIFLYSTKEPFIEDIIFDVKTGIIRQEAADNIVRELDTITSLSSGEQTVYEHSKLLNPSFEAQHRVYYLITGDMLGEDRFSECYRKYVRSPLDIPASLLAAYEGGLLYITTWEHKPGLRDETIAEALRQELGTPDASVGISETHYYLGELGFSIREAMYAALLTYSKSPGTNKEYKNLGLMRFIFPECDNKSMAEYSKSILDPITDYDIENNGKLLETLAAWSENDMNFGLAAKQLHQHENTLRYRMDKICQLTGLDFKNSADAQQLNMAYLIDHCRHLKEKLH